MKKLITGGSGFLGSHIATELSKNEECSILVRDKDKFSKTCKIYGLNPCLENIEIIEGDCSLKDWGIKLNHDIIHCAGIIHATASCYNLKDNFISLENIKESVLNTNSKISLISTLSVFVSTSLKDLKKYKEEKLEGNIQFFGGYAESKYKAEKIIETFDNFKIIRPGLLTGNTINFKFPKKDFFTVFVRAIKRLGVFPSGISAFVDISPVDMVASNIIKAINTEKKYIHISSNKPLEINELICLLDIKKCSLSEFVDKVKKSELSSLEKILLLNSVNEEKKHFNVNLFQSPENCMSEEYKIFRESDLIKNYVKEIL